MNKLGIDTSNVALVLEGGGMRGVFTGGVIDFFLDNNIEFPYVVGVSAGAGNSCNYLSRQRGRTRTLDIDYLEKYNYIGVHKLITKGMIIDNDLLFGQFPTVDYPFDFATYSTNPMQHEMVACNCLTGEAVYLDDRTDTVRMTDICRASCSLPFVSPMVTIDGVPMLDGGISDAIPVRRAFEKGYKKLVLVLTRPYGYRKSPKEIKFPKFIYRKYPNLQSKLRNKNFEYNAVMDFVESEERKGNILVIRPQNLMGVERLEKRREKLTALYNHGYECAQAIANI